MKKYLKLFTLVLISLITFISVGVSVSADTGPKEYVQITVQGNTDGMYMTLLSKQPSSGPFNTEREYGAKNTEINQKFISYSDKDGFYYLRNYDAISNNKYSWGYHPPHTFKILIYDSINDKFITDDMIYNQYAFASTFKLVLTDNSFIVSKTTSFLPELLNFFVRLTICLAIEIGLAFLFGFRKRELLLFLITNVVTQVILNILLSLFIYYNGYQIFVLIGIFVIIELFILLIESIIYLLFIERIDNKYGYKVKNPTIIMLYTFLANVSSLALGFVILTFLPKF